MSGKLLGLIARLGENDGPLERCAVKMLTLSTMAVLRVDWITVELKRDVFAPALPGTREFNKIVRLMKQVSFNSQDVLYLKPIALADPLIGRLLHVVLLPAATALTWDFRFTSPSCIRYRLRMRTVTFVRKRMGDRAVGSLTNGGLGVCVWLYSR